MPTMLYRRDKVPGAAKSERPLRPGGLDYYYQVFEDDEKPDGWYSHPDEIPEKKKPGPKPKVKEDERGD